jgi:hypothetical protein
MNLRDQILSANDCVLKPFPVPEWNVDVCLKTWTCAERAAVQAIHKSEGADWIAQVVALTLCDPVGNKIFSHDDVKALADKNGAVLERIALEALSHNGIGTNAVDDAKNA